MAEQRHQDACALGVALIDAQILMLCTHAALLAEWVDHGRQAPDLSGAQRLLVQRRTDPEAHAHSDDGTPLKRDSGPTELAWPSLNDASQRLAFALHMPCANAIIAVADFFDIHRLSSSRTAEVQFLMRSRDAALNEDTFRILKGEYRPHAAFDGCVIDETLDGKRLLGDGVTPGIIAFGDVVALLRYLRKLLHGMQSAISSGDAG